MTVGERFFTFISCRFSTSSLCWRIKDSICVCFAGVSPDCPRIFIKPTDKILDEEVIERYSQGWGGMNYYQPLLCLSHHQPG